jgi:hypothetical protein
MNYPSRNITCSFVAIAPTEILGADNGDKRLAQEEDWKESTYLSG